MQKTDVSPRQSFFMGMPLLIIMGHFYLIPVYFQWAGRDAWLGVIGAFAVGIIIFIAMGRLQAQLYRNDKTLVEAAHHWLGPWFGRLLTLPLILYFFILSVFTLYGFSVFISSIFLTDHPQWVITVTFALTAVFMVHKGVEVIARVCEWILVYNIVSGTLVSLSLHGQKDYSKLLPIMGNGIKPLFPVVILTLAIFGELIVLLMVRVKPEANSRFNYKSYLMLFVTSLIIFPSTTMGPIAIFGEDQAKLMTFPVESTVRLISVGFIERFDIYGLTIMSVSSLLRLAILHYATSIAAAQWFNAKHYKWFNPAIGAALIAASMKMFNNYIELLDFFRDYYPYGIIFSGVILLLGVVSFFVSKGGKKPKKAA